MGGNAVRLFGPRRSSCSDQTTADRAGGRTSSRENNSRARASLSGHITSSSTDGLFFSYAADHVVDATVGVVCVWWWWLGGGGGVDKRQIMFVGSVAVGKISGKLL